MTKEEKIREIEEFFDQAFRELEEYARENGIKTNGGPYA